MNLILYQIIAVSVTTWKESIRDKGIYTLILSGMFMLLLSQMLGGMAVINSTRILQSMGMWVLGLWGLVSVCYLGSGFINAIHEKSILMLLCRPVNRSAIILGRYLGIFFTLSTIALSLFCTWVLFLGVNSITITLSHVYAGLFIYFEWLLLAGISLLFASFTNVILHNLFVTMFLIFGHLSRDLYIFSENTDHLLLKWTLKIIYYCLPNLELINFRSAVIYSSTVSKEVIFNGSIMFLLWTSVFLFGACLIFHTRKLS